VWEDETMDARSNSRRRRRERRQRRRRVISLVVVLFFVVAGFLLYWNQNNDLATDSAPDSAPAPAPDPAPAPAPTEAEEAETFPVAIRVVDAPSRLTVTVDGQTVLEQLGEPGFSAEFEVNREITIETDNPESVWVVDEGEELGPISGIVGEGAPALTITLEDG
jgi:hypothetical protein